ncbi:unnamed protein product [Mucor circinelloides]
MLVRANFIIDAIHFISSSPAKHTPPSLHDDQDSTVDNQSNSHFEQEAIPEMTAKSAISSHGDYGTIIIHNDNQQGDTSEGVESTTETQRMIALESTSDVTGKIIAEHDMMHSASSTFSSIQPQTDNDSLHSDNLTSYHGILSKKPVSSLLLETPIPSYIGSIDFKESHSFLTDDDTITPPANLIYYKRREDFYPQKIMEQQQQQEEGEISPPALNYNRRQSIQ